jgi:Ulp1 family protease
LVFLIGTQQVDEIWSQSDVTDFVLGNVHGINITDRDIISLKGNGWLTDQVYDVFYRIDQCVSSKCVISVTQYYTKLR